MYTPSHIANFMLDRADSEGRPISQMKLQKLVYIAYGWHLALTDDRLFDEPIYAWDHGPVVESLYHEFKHFRSAPIEGRSISFDLDSDETVEPMISAEDVDTGFILELVWSMYKPYSASQLRAKTHEQGTPWSAVYNERGRSRKIPDNLIKGHFTDKIREYLDHAER